MSTLHVVTLYPYSDGDEARYQFDDLASAQAFADRVNKLPEARLAYLNGSGRPHKVTVWDSSTYDTADEAWAALAEQIGLETA